MPRFYPPIPFDACYGSVGNRTYYHWKGVPYYKKKAYTEFPGTSAQLEQVAIHSRALEAWRSLDASVQKTWNSLAVEVFPARGRRMTAGRTFPATIFS